MRKFVMMLWVTMLFMLLAAQACWAAAVPLNLAATVSVYLEGERVAAAVERDGYTYLPLRTMFETVGAEVEWSEAEQKITATFADGGVLTMQVGDIWAESQYKYQMGDNEYDNPDNLSMEQPAYVSNGTCYVPLRFVTDTVLGYEVEWRDNAVYIQQPRLEYTQGEDKYVLNMATGQLALNGNVVAENIAVPGYAGYHALHINSFTVRRTPQGSYLLEGEGSCRGWMTYYLKWCCWVSADGGSSYGDVQTSMLDYLPGFVCSEGKVWLNGYSHGFGIDEASGHVSQLTNDVWVQQVLGDEYASDSIYWTDGQLILLGGMSGYVLYDMQNQTGLNLTPLLLTNEFAAEANRVLTEKSVIPFNSSSYWENLGNVHEAASPRLKFASAEGGQLRFELTCRYYAYADGGMENEIFPLRLSIEQIKELMK